ncbi:hypothetical protein SAMN05216215_101879 [Saccharopolyspora shandongensis]|uniref:Uncharacterized protein n=1 Tax=Saccharopolyspora shandongensis TaxID=418495 RepID=A0A1H3G9I2_9PSEU|nr:hypothetical protein [Saccharopolyspora shandongensis]SDX99308.1 hypothetical protein SAMN05216215_101879 [Saccharopolyspora shandongensis]
MVSHVRAWASGTGLPKTLAVCSALPTFAVSLWGTYALLEMAWIGPGGGDPSFLLAALGTVLVGALGAWALLTQHLDIAWSLAALLFLIGSPINRELLIGLV